MLVTGKSDTWPISGTPVPIAMRNDKPDQVFVLARIRIPTPVGDLECGGMTYAIPLWDEATYLDLVDPPSLIPDDPANPNDVPTPRCSLNDVTDAQALRDAELTVEVRQRTRRVRSASLRKQPTSASTRYNWSRSTANSQPYRWPDKVNQVAQGGDASFNVIGGYSTPHNDLDVNWVGDLTDPDRPMVDGEHGRPRDRIEPTAGRLAGVICCEVGGRPSGSSI